MIAPHIKPMLMPKPWASGSSTGATAATEPVEVPQEVEMSTQVRNAIMGIHPAFKPRRVIPQIKASIKPLCRRSCASIPAMI